MSDFNPKPDAYTDADGKTPIAAARGPLIGCAIICIFALLTAGAFGFWLTHV